MIVSIHQPNFMPWLGFFEKISKSDVFVILDDAQFEKNSFLNRNKIKSSNGVQWLTLPTKGKVNDKINEAEISNNTDWRKNHLHSLEFAYKKSKNFNSIFSGIKEIYEQKNWVKMADLNLALIYFLMNKLNIRDKKIVLSSDLAVEGKSSERLLSIVQKLGGDVYFSGVTGKDYLDEELFKRHNIKVIYQTFQHPVYKQCWGEFVPNLSAIDYLFNA